MNNVKTILMLLNIFYASILNAQNDTLRAPKIKKMYIEIEAGAIKSYITGNFMTGRNEQYSNLSLISNVGLGFNLNKFSSLCLGMSYKTFTSSDKINLQNYYFDFYSLFLKPTFKTKGKLFLNISPGLSIDFLNTNYSQDPLDRKHTVFDKNIKLIRYFGTTGINYVLSNHFIISLNIGFSNALKPLSKKYLSSTNGAGGQELITETININYFNSNFGIQYCFH